MGPQNMKETAAQEKTSMRKQVAPKQAEICEEKNKAVFTTIPVAGGWAGAVMNWAGAVLI